MEGIPPPPAGFTLDAPTAAGAVPPPPAGFTLDAAPPPAPAPAPIANVGAQLDDPTASASPGSYSSFMPPPPQAPQPPAPPQPPQTPVEAGRLVQHGLTSFNKKFGDIVHAPGELIDAAALVPANYVREKLGLQPVDLSGPGTARGDHAAYNRLTATAPPAGNNAERAVRAGGEMVAADLPLALTGLGTAYGGLRTGASLAETPTVGNAFRGAYDAVKDWMVRHPTASTLGREASSFEAGAGGETARGMAENAGASEGGQHAAEFAGQLGTPAVMAAWGRYSPTALAIRGTNYLGRKATQNLPESVLPEALRPPSGTFADRQAESLAYGNREGKYANPAEPPPAEPNFFTRQQDVGAKERTQRATERVGADFRKVTSQPEAAANAAEVERLQEKIPGFEPGVARATDDPALKNLQSKIEGQATGDELRRAQGTYDKSKQSIKDAFESVVPPTTGEKPPQDVVAGAVRNRVSETNSRVDTQAADVRGKIRETSESLPEVDRIEGGNVMRQSREAAQRAMDMETQRLRSNIANPETPITVKGEQTTVNAALDRRATINQEVRDITSASARSPADMARLRELQTERDALDTAIENVNLPGMREYTAHYREQNVPQFRQGASAEVGRRDAAGYGGNRVDPEQVGKKFFNPNEESAARQFNTSMGHDPAARQQMVDNALDDLRHTGTGPDGLLREGAVAKWLKRNERVLNEVPFVRDAVKAKDPDQLYKRLGDLEQRQREVGQTKVAGLLGTNPENHISAAFNDWQVMRGLKRSVAGDPVAEGALRRAVMDRAPFDKGSAKMQEWLESNKRALSQVLEPGHLQTLQDIVKASQIQERLPRPKGSAEPLQTIADKAADKTGLSVQGFLSRALNVAKGYMSPQYAAGDIALRAWHNISQKDVDAAWREALSNPQVAKNLAWAGKGEKPTPIQLSRLHNYLITIGVLDTAGYPAQPPLGKK